MNYPKKKKKKLQSRQLNYKSVSQILHSYNYFQCGQLVTWYNVSEMAFNSRPDYKKIN